jgi:hypothetical protein
VGPEAGIRVVPGRGNGQEPAIDIVELHEKWRNTQYNGEKLRYEEIYA